jgi:hypothetical protein
LLPLSDSLKCIAVIGPSANSVRLLQGDYHYPSHLEGILDLDEKLETPSPHLQKVMDNWDKQFPESTTILEGIITIRTNIKNIGKVVGDEVVQLYVQDSVASVTRPVKELKGFKRVSLQPGEQKTVSFQLEVRHLAFYDRQMNYVVEPGTIEVMIGSSSSDIRLQDNIMITGETTKVDQVFQTPVEVIIPSIS